MVHNGCTAHCLPEPFAAPERSSAVDTFACSYVLSVVARGNAKAGALQRKVRRQFIVKKGICGNSGDPRVHWHSPLCVTQNGSQAFDFMA
jgi:hypothetical protein